jgi:hypothetical protein
MLLHCAVPHYAAASVIQIRSLSETKICIFSEAESFKILLLFFSFGNSGLFTFHACSNFVGSWFMQCETKAQTGKSGVTLSSDQIVVYIIIVMISNCVL